MDNDYRYILIACYTHTIVYFIDGSLYLLDPNSVKIQHRIPLANISHISASQLPDNFFIVHVPSEQDRLFVSGYVLIQEKGSSIGTTVYNYMYICCQKTTPVLQVIFTLLKNLDCWFRLAKTNV